jgi:hypothetical protein
MIYIRVILECLAVAAVCYAIYREKDLIILERKIYKYIKAFLKACYYSLKEVIVK